MEAVLDHRNPGNHPAVPVAENVAEAEVEVVSEAAANIVLVARSNIGFAMSRVAYNLALAAAAQVSTGPGLPLVSRIAVGSAASAGCYC